MYKVSLLPTISLPRGYPLTGHPLTLPNMQANGIQCFTITAVLFAAGTQYASQLSVPRMHAVHALLLTPQCSLDSVFQAWNLRTRTPV